MFLIKILIGDSMKHTIDLSKYQLRTDLAIEAAENEKIESEIKEYDTIKVTKTHLNEEIAKKIGKQEGTYITIEFDDVTDYQNRNQVTQVFENTLKELLQELKIEENNTCLVIGLGNKKSTPDSLGPLSIDNILVTRYLFLYDNPEEGFRNVSAFIPGVTGTTGIETSDLIEAAIHSIHPDFLIVIDALASRSIERVNKTIQISDSGIHPGSGVGNARKEISRKKLGIPVIAIGIPTVVDAVTIVSDTIQYMHRHYAFHKNFSKNPMHNLTISSQMNYLKENVEIKEEDKRNLLGIIGSLTEDETKQLLSEVLTPIGYNLMVTTKEIDFLIENLSQILGKGINHALHKKIKDL